MAGGDPQSHVTHSTVAFLLLGDRPTGYYPLGPLQARPCVATLRHPWLRTFPKGNNQRDDLPHNLSDIAPYSRRCLTWWV